MNLAKVSALTAVSPRMLRYYEELGLIAPKRGDNNYRSYSEHDIKCINKIKILNENSDFEVSVKSADISGITIIGPKADIAALTKDDITLSVNLENVTISKGNFNAVLTVSTGNDTCWAYGTYNAVLTAK